MYLLPPCRTWGLTGFLPPEATGCLKAVSELVGISPFLLELLVSLNPAGSGVGVREPGLSPSVANYELHGSGQTFELSFLI